MAIPFKFFTTFRASWIIQTLLFSIMANGIIGLTLENVTLDSKNGNHVFFDQEDVKESSISPFSSIFHPLLSSNYYIPESRRTNQLVSTPQIEPLPFPYDHSLGYPVVQSNNDLLPSSKHFVVVSFIGLLLLFAIIQNSIMTTKGKDAIVDILTSRKKRDTLDMANLEKTTPEQDDVLNTYARIRCIQRTICLENRRLFKDLGSAGKTLARYLTNSVESSLRNSSGWDRLVEDAGAAGFRGDDCNVLYRDCDVDFPKISMTHSSEILKSFDKKKSLYSLLQVPDKRRKVKLNDENLLTKIGPLM